MSDRTSLLSGAFAVLLAVSVAGQASAQSGAADVDQMLADADALVVSTDVTTRCALFDDSIVYLTPLEQVAAQIRLGEIATAAAETIEDAPDRIARMRAEAAAIACGDPDLTPYMDFGRQTARDVIDIALFAWRSIDVPGCNYFADDDFMRAAERATMAAEQATIEGAANRVTYIEQRGAAWAEIFATNCANLGFEPVETLPGQIALALPTQ